MICPKCGKENPELGKFCNHCGASLKQSKVCSRCGAESPQTSRFCYHCGADLDQTNVCPKCKAEYNEGDEFCTRCGTKLVQEPVIRLDILDIEPETKSNVEPSANRGIQPEHRSATLKWVTGILGVFIVLYIIGLIGLIALTQMGYEVPDLPLQLITLFIIIAATVCAVKRRLWGFVLGTTIWLLIVEIRGSVMLSAAAESCPILPEQIALNVFALLLAVTCLILLSRTKAEFS